MSTKKLDPESKTHKNLKEALAGEAQAALRYMFYATKAKKDGYEEIADILNFIAHNEIQHAKIWYKTLNEGISDTLKNIKSAANGSPTTARAYSSEISSEGAFFVSSGPAGFPLSRFFFVSKPCLSSRNCSTMKRGRFLVSRYILPIYSPITPSDNRIAPPMPQMESIVVVQPTMVSPIAWRISE